MDSITHVVAGAAIGELMLGKKIGKKAMLWGALAASAPDIDALLYLFTDDVDSLMLHRGLSHSILAAFVASPLLAWLFSQRVPAVSFKQWNFFFLLQILLHNALDTATIYGTGLIVPFSEHRYSWDNIFVLDPLFTLPMLFAFVALLIIKPGNRSRSVWASAGLILSTLYFSMTFFNKSLVESVFLNTLKEKGIEYGDHFTAPVILNNFLWNTVAATDSGYYVGHYSLFDKNRMVELHFIPRNEELLGNFINSKKVAKLKRFSQGFYCVTYDDHGVWFNDMRFGQINGWENSQAQFAFSFNLHEGADNSTVVQRGRIEASKREALKSLWNRIKGK